MSAIALICAGMSSHIARGFARKFCACSLYLQHCGEDERALQSELRADDVSSTLVDAKLSRADEAHISELVASKAHVWRAVDIEKITKAVVRCCAVGVRREMQAWGVGILHIFTDAERDEWRQQAPEIVMVDIITRLKLLNAKSLCEKTKKMVIAMWFHYRDDFWKMSAASRAAFVDHMRDTMGRQFKHFVPAKTVVKLPSFDVLQRISEQNSKIKIQ